MIDFFFFYTKGIFKIKLKAIYALSSRLVPTFQAESHLLTHLIVKCFSSIFIGFVLPLVLRPCKFLRLFNFFLQLIMKDFQHCQEKQFAFKFFILQRR